jgi:hypothetical protein
VERGRRRRRADGGVLRDDGGEELDRAGRGLDEAPVAVALGDGGPDLPERGRLAAGGVEERGDAAGVERRLRGREALDLVRGAPGLDEPAQRVVGRGLALVRRQRAPRDGAGALAVGEETALDAGAVVGDARGQRHRVAHHLQRDRAREVVRYLHRRQLRTRSDVGVLCLLWSEAISRAVETGRGELAETDRRKRDGRRLSLPWKGKQQRRECSSGEAVERRANEEVSPRLEFCACGQGTHVYGLFSFSYFFGIVFFKI